MSHPTVTLSQLFLAGIPVDHLRAAAPAPPMSPLPGGAPPASGWVTRLWLA
jgi:hypothetical protein